MNPVDVTTAIAEGQAVGDEILTVLEGLPLGVAPEAAVAQKLLDLITKYATVAITAYSAASGVAITPESVAALMPDQTPLNPPPTP